VSRFVGSFALGLLLVGCGSTSSHALGRSGGAGGSSGDAGGSGGTDAGARLAVPGSYELVVDEVTVTDATRGGPPAPAGVKSPSEGQIMRFDVRRGQAGAVESIVTPRWGMPARMDGSATGGTYELSGGLLVSGFSNGNVGDNWTTLRVAAGDQGLGTSVTMKGTQHVVQGDVVWMNDLAATATLRRDETPPELRSAPASVRGPESALLPWDPIEVKMAEPIDKGDFALEAVVASTQREEDSGAEAVVPVTWQSIPADEAVSWAGIVRSLGRLNEWGSSPAQKTSHHEVRVSAGLADPTGLVSTMFVSPFSVLGVGNAVPEFTFDTADEQRPAWWGLTTVDDGTSGRCERGGCLEVGPYNAPYCGAERSGVAGRVQAPTGTLELRYRLLHASDPTAPDQPAKVFGAVFVIEVARAGAEVTTDVVNAPPAATLTDMGAGELRWASPWTTVSVSLPGPTPPSVADLGFSIGPGDAVSTICGGGPLPPSVKTLLVIDSISGR
jgi:hypothetical protein